MSEESVKLAEAMAEIGNTMQAEQARTVIAFAQGVAAGVKIAQQGEKKESA